MSPLNPRAGRAETAMTEPASDPNANVRAEALRHLKAGRVVLAVGFREKFPVDELGRKLDAWRSLRLSERDLPRYFNGQPLNLGILLGEPSGWLVDLDLDTPEARELVARVLPVTATFGRPSSRRSHWLFIAEGAVTTKFLEPDPAELTSQGKPKIHTLLELRSTGMQTVFPPSTHKSGEPIAWEEGPTEPTRIDAAELRRLAGRLAAATLLKRRAPDLLEGYLAAPDVVPPGVPELYLPVLRRFLGLASPEPARRTTSPAASALFNDALAAYNAEHTRDWGRAGGSCCPVCCQEGGCSCFGRSKRNAARWSCFNTDHPDDCGHKSDDGTYHSGDALDLDAFGRGRTPAEHLRAEGYLADRSSAPGATSREEPPPHTDNEPPWLRAHLSLVPGAPEPDDAPAPGTEAAPDVVPEPPAPARGVVLVRTGRGYAAVVEVVSAPEFSQRVCEGRHLEYNTMAGRPELGREPLADHLVNRARQRVPQYFGVVTSKTKQGQDRVTPYEPQKDDFWSALDQVAHERPYHPVAEYLRGLTWDKVERLAMLPHDVLGVTDPGPITTAIARKWFVAAVARALKPGCKVDTSLILVGPQSALKTSFFERVAVKQDWYLSFDEEVAGRDAQQLLNAAWIVELSELESLRGREITKFKAFSTRRTDRWVGKWQRAATSIPRSFVIVGTTNDDAFLDDPTGNRRFWPIEVGPRIRLDLLEAWRDQLWAEAVALYDAGEQWWLDDVGETELETAQAAFEIRDTWETRIAVWLDTARECIPETPVTVAGALEGAVLKPPGQWGKSDAQRVAAILRRLGWRRRRKRVEGGERPWVWEPRAQPQPDGGEVGPLVRPEND
jgi:hypothetical protein